MRLALLLMLPALACALDRQASRATPRMRDPDAGVSEALARERAHRVSNVRYDVSLAIPADRQLPVAGTVTATFMLGDVDAPLAFDFAPDRAGLLRAVSRGGEQVDIRHVNGHIIVPKESLQVGENRLTFTVDAGNAPLNRSADFLYTLFVPARAHLALPCFDQPDLKARWSLTLEIPDTWEAISNGAEVGRDTQGGRIRVRFAETQPIATYLFAFGAGRFSVETAQRDGRTFRMFHRETDAAKVARNRDAIFDLHAAALAWLERYTGIPYPFGKFDFLLVPAFQFGGMEHPGAIFYNATGLMLDESATQDQKLGRASLIAHETSHMWFGDLVTMRWFSDVWMKEVFANFMAAKIVNPSFPGINHDLRFLLAYYPAAYDVDRTAGTNEIRQPLANLDDAGTLYGAIIYQKAPIVMRQLETMMGAEPFRDGLREYLNTYAFRNAAWTDLIALLDGRTPEDLPAWSRAWVDERARPTIRTELTISKGRIDRLVLTQQDPIARRGLIWNQRIQVAIGESDETKATGHGFAATVTLLPVKLDAARVEVAAARGLPAEFVLPNGAGLAYGELHLDPTSLSWLMTNLPAIEDELTRGSAWVTVWDAVLDGEAPADALIALALRALPYEASELNVQRVLSYLTKAYWTFTPPAARRGLAPRLERVLREGLASAASPSLKSAWFSALRDTAQTPETLAWLTRVWKQQEAVPGLTMSETDYIRLAEELAVRDVPDADNLLAGQLERTANPDRKAQFAFVRPALSGDATVRDAWFASLGDPANRRREPWVLEGLRYLHHPLRASASEQYVAKSLDMLVEIQRTGDIFFPKRWMDVTLSGYQTPSAATTVRTFLDRLPPTYPERLRRIILSSADDLFRAARER
jgi:aminopeptidase N